MDIRSENKTGKLLFKWDPDTDIVSISCRDAVYDVKLIRRLEGSTYCVVRKRYKKASRDSQGKEKNRERYAPYSKSENEI